MTAVRLAPLGSNKISMSGSTVYTLGSGLTDDAIPAGADVARLTVETANVRARFDGVAPDATTGILLTVGAGGLPPYEIAGGLQSVKLTPASGSPVVNVAFFRIVG